MMGDLAPGASMPGLDPDIGEVAAIAQPKQKTLEESLDELLPVTSVDPFATERPSMRDRISARRATRGSENPVNPVMDWLSGTDWSQGREAGKRPVLANVGPKLLNAAGFVNPQIAMLNRAIDMGKSFKKSPKEASLGILGSLIGNRFGARGQNIFNVARGIRGGDSFKQGLGNLFMGELLGGMGKNRDVGQGILSMIGGKDPRQILGNLALGRATRRMDPTQGALFGAGVETMKGRPGMEAFGSAFKNIARRQGMQKLFQRAYQKGGRPAVQKLRAAMSFVPGGG
jgi:hypothetical protein